MSHVATRVGRPRRWRRLGVLALSVVVVVVAVVAINSLGRPPILVGEGTIGSYGFGCLSIVMDGESAKGYPIASWPNGLSSYMTTNDTVVDLDGNTVVRVGDRVSLKATIKDQRGGDIPACFANDVISVEWFQVLPAGP